MSLNPVCIMEFKPILVTQPRITNKQISTLYSEYLQNRENLNLRPVYQRNACWNTEQKANLVDSVMNGIPIPLFLLYIVSTVRECIDGQNRLSAIKQYMDQNPGTTETDELFFWTLTDDSSMHKELIYFKETPEFTAFREEKNAKKKRGRGYTKIYRPMTELEKIRFQEYEVVVQIINTPLTLDQRKEMFNKWQNGTSISQCDSFKNEDHPFCTWVIRYKLEARFADRLAALLKSGRNNWLFDIYRMMNTFVPNRTVDQVLLSSIQARNNISRPKDAYDMSEKTVLDAADHLDAFLNRIEVLESERKSINISYLLSLAHFWFTLREDTYRSILEEPDFLLDFARCSHSLGLKMKKTMNNAVDTKEVADNYPKFESEIIKKIQSKIAVQSPVSYKKKKIPAALKLHVWDAHIGKSIGVAKCMACLDREIRQSDFECGHVVAEACGGLNVVENMRPICAKCNRSMGTHNMKDWVHANFPGRIFH